MQGIPMFVPHPSTQAKQEQIKGVTHSSQEEMDFTEVLLQIQQDFLKTNENQEGLQKKKQYLQVGKLVETEQQPLDTIDEDLKNDTVHKDIGNTLQMVPEVYFFDLKSNDENIMMMEHPISNELSSPNDTTVEKLSLKNEIVDMHTNMKMKRIFEKVLDMMAVISSEQNLKKISPEILHVLKEWTHLKNPSHSTSLHALNQEQSHQMKMWDELVERYEQRMESNVKNTYSLESKVTTREIVKWLRAILGEQNMVKQSTFLKQVQDVNAKQVQVESKSNQILQSVTPSGSLPMTKVEQYVIHLDRSQGVQPIDLGKEMAEKIQNLVKNHSFMLQSSGKNQLSILFRPEQLGEMFLRFAQVNGETVVRIIVSSQVAQQALDSNIHQLKHMFSPHQVVIERQDLSLLSTEDVIHPEKDNHEQSQQDNQQEKDTNEQTNHTDEFENQLEQFLLNEKV